MVIKQNKTCLITGAAGGIGQALVNTFHENGYTVIATDIVNKPQNIKSDFYVQADLIRAISDENYAKSVFEEMQHHLPGEGLNVLINNAAIQILGGIESLCREDWTKTMSVNVFAPFLLCQFFYESLKITRGSVVNISSIHARLTKKNFLAYSTSKAALSALTRGLALEFKSDIRVNCIEPAAIYTQMLRDGFNGKEDLYDEMISCHPQNKIGVPDEVARLALHLCEDNMDFIHGACIEINGAIGCKLHDPD